MEPRSPMFEASEKIFAEKGDPFYSLTYTLLKIARGEEKWEDAPVSNPVLTKIAECSAMDAGQREDIKRTLLRRLMSCAPRSSGG